MYVTAANRRVWQAHGFDADPWDRAVQFRRNIVDCQFASDSGFVAEYAFRIRAEDFQLLKSDGNLKVALEHPELYTIECNDLQLEFGTDPWLDETIRVATVSHAIKAGNNVIRMTASPFQPLMEIDRIYVLGQFAAVPGALGFEMIAPRAISPGDWTRLGLPMYNESVRYRYGIELANDAQQVRIKLPDWKGAVARAWLDDVAMPPIGFPPYESTLRHEVLAGSHTLEIEVTGTLKNLLGPHFCSLPLTGRWTTPAAWDEAPSHHARGDEYEILPYGLFADPIVEIC
jgi:hypothetical protein